MHPLTERILSFTLAPTEGLPKAWAKGMNPVSVRERIEASASNFTGSERKLAAALLADYPYAGLETIQDLALRAEVSAPSISRFVAKIGLAGYQEFQRRLLSELKEGNRSPVEVHGGGRAVDGGYLGDFIARATAQMAVSGEAITEAQFERVCELVPSG